MKRTQLKRRTPLRAKTTLKSRIGLKTRKPLRAHKPINRISRKQQAQNKTWREVTRHKAANLDFICQWCGQHGTFEDDYNPLSGHHIIKRSKGRIDTYWNCYVAHWTTCHEFIENHGIDVRNTPNLEVYLREIMG